MEKLLKDFGQAVVRTPLYPFSVLFDEESKTMNLEELTAVFLEDPVFLEGLYWSSPQLYGQVLKLRENNLKEPRKKNLLNTITKYLIRAATRPTPYGIFAGSDISFIDKGKDYTEKVMERKVSVDRSLLQAIRTRLESDPAIAPHLQYAVNNTLYSIPGQYRYMETIIENGTHRYQLSSIDQTPFLQKIISVSGHNKFSVRQLFELTVEDASFEEFMVFFNELVQSQFFQSELMPGPTIDNQLRVYTIVLERLRSSGINEAQKYLRLARSLETTLNRFRELPLGELPIKTIEDVKSRLLECDIEPYQDHLLHVNLKKSIGPGFILSAEKVKEIKTGISVLGKLAGSASEPDEIQHFKKVFAERYGDSEVPLLEVLDPEFGIGFPARKRIGYAFFNAMTEKIKPAASTTKTKQNQLLDKIAGLYAQTAKAEVCLEDSDLQGMEANFDHLPPYFSVMCSFLHSGKILLESAGTSHSNSLLGRFGGLDPAIGDLVKEVSETEQASNPDVIFAEIAFEPAGRVGNVVSRPPFYEHEIPILAASAVAEQNQVFVEDLLVSVSRNEVVFRSRKHNKRLIPRLSNAHNFGLSNIPVYRFLSALQTQHQRGFAIGWQNPGCEVIHLPRITYKNLILHRACWYLNKNDIKAITGATEPVEKLSSLLKIRHVPQQICLAEGDRELFIDTGNQSYLELMVNEMRGKSKIKLVEWLYESSFAGNGSNPIVHQVILPLARTQHKAVKSSNQFENPKTIETRFDPGSEWLYFKLYCSSGYSDQILTRAVKPVIDKLLSDGIIDEAFFIRYTDPHYHIRLRLHLVDNSHLVNFGTALKEVNDRMRHFTTSGVVWKVQMETYQREIERYGSNGILSSEWAFFYDSLLYFSCLQHEIFIDSDETRFFAALKNIDSWLDLFGLSLNEKVEYCHQLCENFLAEFGPEVQFRIDQKYRELSNTAISFLNSPAFDHEFRQRNNELRELALSRENLANYIHMSINRWFLTDQRLLEFMAYLFCSKYYNQLKHFSPKKEGFYPGDQHD